MKSSEALDRLLPSFMQYYDVTRENVAQPFSAEAKFVSHSEQYFLVKAAKLSDIDSMEHIFFAAEESLSEERLRELCNIAWTEGLKNVQPYYGHRNSDVSVIILAESLDDAARKSVKKIKYSKNYKFMLYGWSCFKLIVADLSSMKTVCNTYAKDLDSVVSKVMKKWVN